MQIKKIRPHNISIHLNTCDSSVKPRKGYSAAYSFNR